MCQPYHTDRKAQDPGFGELELFSPITGALLAGGPVERNMYSLARRSPQRKTPVPINLRRRSGRGPSNWRLSRIMGDYPIFQFTPHGIVEVCGAPRSNR